MKVVPENYIVNLTLRGCSMCEIQLTDEVGNSMGSFLTSSDFIKNLNELEIAVKLKEYAQIIYTGC